MTNQNRQQRRQAAREDFKQQHPPRYFPQPRKTYHPMVEQLIAIFEQRQGHPASRQQRRALMAHGAAGLKRLLAEVAQQAPAERATGEKS